MQCGDFGGERRLIADAGWQAPEQARDFTARLDEAKHVVHQQQDVLSLLVAEILRNRQRGQPDPPARAGRLVHLAVDQHAAVEHAGSPHLGEELVAFAGALANTGKDGNALVAFDHRMDELHDHDGLADTGAAEHGRLAALRERSEKIDDLDAGFEYRGGRTAVSERRRRAVDGRTRHVGRQRRAVVADVAGDVEQTTENRIADRHGDRTSGRAHRRRRV